jgi:AcrR family transcriptional regulator
MRMSRTESQAQTRTGLVDAAERLFSDQGFDKTSLDAVAEAAGYTKGAVYSNFSSKEDLFFAVYERRVERYVADVEPRLSEAADTAQGVIDYVAGIASRRADAPADGWLAVFFEFWTHVLRHPEYRERFAAIHRRAIEPFVVALERFAAERDTELPLDAFELATAVYAMTTGISLERLTQPDAVEADLAVRMQELMFDALARGAPVEAKGA